MQFSNLYASGLSNPKRACQKGNGKTTRQKHLSSLFLAEDVFQLSPNTVINLLKMKNKDYYWLLINKDNQEIQAEVKWSRD